MTILVVRGKVGQPRYAVVVAEGGGMTEVGQFVKDQAALVAACQLLVAAANAHEAQERLHEAGLLDGDGGALASLQSGDLVMIARTALYRLLVLEGWTAPEQVRREVLLDKRVLDLATGASGG